MIRIYQASIHANLHPVIATGSSWILALYTGVTMPSIGATCQRCHSRLSGHRNAVPL